MLVKLNVFSGFRQIVFEKEIVGLVGSKLKCTINLSCCETSVLTDSRLPSTMWLEPRVYTFT